MALVRFCVCVILQIGKVHPSAVRKTPRLILFRKLSANRPVDQLGALNHLHKLGPLTPHSQCNRVFAVLRREITKIPEHRVCFPSTPRASKKHFKNRALQEKRLTRLGLPDYDLLRLGHLFFLTPSCLTPDIQRNRNGLLPGSDLRAGLRTTMQLACLVLAHDLFHFCLRF